MPNYKTHSIHSDMTMPYIDKRISIDKEKLKLFSFGPDPLVFSDVKTFNNQHNRNTKAFFKYLIKTIKLHKYTDNEDIMAFLYGQLEHFILDTTFHPYVSYVTSGLKRDYLLDQHVTFELWLDDYFMNKYNIHDKKYYSNFALSDELKSLIDHIYKKVYKCSNASNKFDFGTKLLLMLENTRSNDKVIPNISKTLGISDISYDEINRIIPYVNNDRDIWYNPYTLDSHHESINELWNNSVSLFLEVVDDTNKYLYDDKPFKNITIDSNLSYDTGIPSSKGKQLLLSKINKEV